MRFNFRRGWGRDADRRVGRAKPQVERLLVIKFGPLGDFALSLGAFAAIRRHHPEASIVLLTTAPFQEFAQESGYFDEVWSGGHPPGRAVMELLRLVRRLRRAGFARVYDLEGSRRTALYFYLLGRRKPEWSGAVRRASHPDRNPVRKQMHILPRLAEQLRQAGIPAIPEPDVSWVDSDITRFNISAPFALLVPGGGRRVPSCWPGDSFNTLAKVLADRGLHPVVLGSGRTERLLASRVLRGSTGGISLTDQTSLMDIVALGRAATVAVGNDTGPVYLTALSGAPTVVLLSSAALSEVSTPRGPRVELLDAARLNRLTVTRVLQALPPPVKRDTLP